MSGWVAAVTAEVIVFFARGLTAVQAVWQGNDPAQEHQRIFFSNHSSHGDFILIWSALPPGLRRKTRPVAGADYWDRGRLRRFIGSNVFNAVLISRGADDRETDPVGQMTEALEQGASLILFPEGTRNLTDEILLPFKSGLFHLARARPDIDLVPVWIENLNRVLPKGTYVPVPLMCKVSFGPALHLAPKDTKDDFLERARLALIALCPKAEVAAAG
jgi:1-acyl-sn-glycerol-3-phosphate acyltransferase